MLGLAVVAISGALGVTCASEETQTDYHAMDVCSSLFVEDAAYSATMRASLVPQPASQQITLFRLDNVWRLRIAGFRWKPEGAIETRRRDIEISGDDALRIIQRLSTEDLKRMSKLPLYGGDSVICTDGATFELAKADKGKLYSARQHSCAGKNEVHETMSVFREIALKYDASFDGFLSGLKAA